MNVADTAAEVAKHYVTLNVVAEIYGVSKLRVYRAVTAGKLSAIRVRGGQYVIDERTLPPEFPS